LTFDKYIEKNYTELIEVARILFKGTQLDPAEIISELYLDVKTKGRKIKPTELDYKYYCIRWIKNATKWTGGNPVKKLKVIDTLPEAYINQETQKNKSEYLDGNEIVKDLQRLGFSEDQADRLENCIIISKKLPLYSRRLFELYYLEGLSLNDIATSCSSNTCKIPKVSIHRDIKRLNEKLIIKLKNN